MKAKGVCQVFVIYCTRYNTKRNNNVKEKLGSDAHFTLHHLGCIAQGNFTYHFIQNIYFCGTSSQIMHLMYCLEDLDVHFMILGGKPNAVQSVTPNPHVLNSEYYKMILRPSPTADDFNSCLKEVLECIYQNGYEYITMDFSEGMSLYTELVFLMAGYTVFQHVCSSVSVLPSFRQPFRILFHNFKAFDIACAN